MKQQNIMTTKFNSLVIGLVLAGAEGAVGQPAVTTQPQNQTNYVGTTASFTVAATGTGSLSYQWQKYFTNFADIPNASNAVLTLCNVQTNDAADYRVVVTDSTGTTNSSTAHVFVIPPATLFVSQPAPGMVTLSWQGSMALLECALADGQSLDCAAWVRVADTSPVTFPIHNDTRFFRLVVPPSISNFPALQQDRLDACRGGDCKACEEFVAGYFMVAPVEELPANPFAEEAASIGIELGSCVLDYYLQILIGLENGARSFDP